MLHIPTAQPLTRQLFLFDIRRMCRDSPLKASTSFDMAPFVIDIGPEKLAQTFPHFGSNSCCMYLSTACMTHSLPASVSIFEPRSPMRLSCRHRRTRRSAATKGTPPQKLWEALHAPVELWALGNLQMLASGMALHYNRSSHESTSSSSP